MCDRCPILEDEILYLRTLLGEQEDDNLKVRLATLFGLSPAETRLAQRLFQAPGIVSAITLEETVEVGIGSLRVHVARIRRKLGGGEAIETHWRLGYRMSDAGRETIRCALETGATPPWRSRGVRARQYVWTPPRVTALRRYRHAGMSMNEIAALLTVSRQAVAGAMYRYDVP